MLGFGESEEEVLGAIADLKKVDCDILTWASIWPLPPYIFRSRNLSLRRNLSFIRIMPKV